MARCSSLRAKSMCSASPGGALGQLRGVFLLELARAPALAAVLLAERLEDGDEVLVSDALEVPDGEAACLRVGLLGDLVHQLVSQFRHVGELRPRPFEAGAELRHEVAYAGLAAGNPVGLEQAHLRPAQAEGVADDVIQLRD